MFRRHASGQRHLRTALVAAGVMGAIVIGIAGRRAPHEHWVSAQLEPQDGTNAFQLAPSADWDDLECVSSYRSHHSMQISGRDSSGVPILATAEYTLGQPLRTISTQVLSAADGDTLIFWRNRWLVSAVSRGRGPSDLLIWFPEAWYERACSAGRSDTIGLFRHNYAMDFKLLNTNTFMTSLEAAACGESLAVYSRLAIVDLDGEEKLRFAFDPRYTADEGSLYETPDGGRIVIVETDGGYSNSDLFYMLLSQPQVSDGAAVTLRSSEDIDGSYRGLFTVDVEKGVPLWYRRLGVTSLKNHLVDLDGDGIDEILLETYCAENNVSGGGTTDSGTAYIICLDQGGNILWKKRFLGTYVGVQSAAVDVTGDDQLELLVTWSSGFFEDQGGAAVLSADGRTLVERTDLGGLYGMAVADFDGDGEIEIATGGPESSIYMLNANLEVECSRTDSTDLLMPAYDPNGVYAGRCFQDAGVIWRHRVMPVAASDVNGDGAVDVLALQTMWQRWDMGIGTILCGRGDLVVLDARLEELMRAPRDYREDGARGFPVDMPASRKVAAFPLDIDADGEDEFILDTSGRGLYAYRDLHAD